jgi:hypothetical protein
MANVSVTLNATVSVTDTTLSPSVTTFTRNFNNPTLAATGNAIGQFIVLSSTSSPVTFPNGISVIYFLYIRNLSNAANINVGWQPEGGSAISSVVIIAPGGCLIWAQTTETAGTPIGGLTNGLTSVSLTASAANTPAEVLAAA